MIKIYGEAAIPLEGASVQDCGGGVFSVLHEGRSYEVRVLAGEVIVNGLAMPYEIEDPRAWKGSAGAGGAKGAVTLKAPMPGKIVKVLVAVGGEVAAGQGIVLMEAMKMQNELKSPKAGRVASVAVQSGDSVAAGAVLAVVE